MSTKHMIFSQYLSSFLFDRESIGKATTTIRYYKQELNQFNRWLISRNLENQNITEFTPTQLREYFIDLSKTTGRHKGGIHASFRAVRAIFNWIWEEEDIIEVRNPIHKVKVESNKIPPLEEMPTENIIKMINECSHRRYQLRDRSILYLLFDSGMRASELCSLKYKDINLENGQINIWHGKGDKFRIVWIGENCRRTIKEYLDSRNNLEPDTYLFINQEGKKITYSALRGLIEHLARLANVPNQGVHSIRRAMALTLWRKKVDLLTISRLLGHSNLEVTTRYLNVGNLDLMEIHNQNSPADLLQ